MSADAALPGDALPAWRQVLRLGLPQALGLMGHALVNLVDLVLVGRLGEDAIKAAGVASTINFVPMVFGNGVATASLALLSQKLGSGDLPAARVLHDRCQRFMLGFGLLVSVLTALPAAWCVDTTGLGGAARADAIQYLWVSNLGCLPMFALMQVTTGMRALGEVAVPLFLLAFANLLNLGLDLVCMFGWDAIGVDGVGVVGAAYATVTSRAVAALLGYLWLFRRRHRLRLTCHRHRDVQPLVGPLLRMAVPQTMQVLLRALLAWAVLVLAQRAAGDDALAALGITTRLDTLMLFSSVGFASAATALVGRAVVRGEVAHARRCGQWAGLQSAVFAALLVLLLYVWRVPLVLLFVPEASPQVVATAALYLGVAVIAQPFACFALGAIGALHGAGRMGTALATDVVGFLALAALMAIAATWGSGLTPLYTALVAGSAVLAVLHAAQVQWGSWARHPRL